MQTEDEKSQMSTGFRDIDHGHFGGMHPLSIPSLGSVLSVKGPQVDILTWNLLFFPPSFETSINT